MDSKRKNRTNYILYSFKFLFILSFVYFLWWGDYILLFQEDQSLFVLSYESVKEYFIRSGGPLELINNFLTQFYIYPVAGSLIISISLILTGIVFLKITRKLGYEGPFTLFLVLIPPVLLLLMQTHYYHKLEYTLGILALLLYFLLVLYKNHLTVLIFFPLFYYLTGFYAWIFLLMTIVYFIIFGKGQSLFYTFGLMVVMTGISFLIFYFYLLPQPAGKFFMDSLPLVKDPGHYNIFYLLTGYIILYSFVVKISGSARVKNKLSGILQVVSLLFIFGLTFIFLAKLHNPRARHVFQIQKYVYENRWDDAIELQEKVYSKNQIGQYFYNIALAEDGKLCDRLFFGGQDFGVNAILLPMSREHLERGGYFYYTVGLINEAHRWAYETMVVYGHRPQNIKMLVKTNLINGNYRMAEKYLNILERSITYKGWAQEYKKMLYDSEKVKAHAELGPKLKLLPQGDFFIKIGMPQENINLLLDSNPGKPIFEYKMCEYMLMKNVEAVVNNIDKFNTLGYDKIPRHIEEVLLVYYNTTGKFPEMYGFEISDETKARFNQYVDYMRQGRANMKATQKKLNEKFGNTFWYYLNFK
ncbi:MAG: hypothetical protein GX126_10010 [Bacteroidales bacterium]|nr:hypothetical protein [Bacteroidales bacterium]